MQRRASKSRSALWLALGMAAWTAAVVTARSTGPDGQASPAAAGISAPVRNIPLERASTPQAAPAPQSQAAGGPVARAKVCLDCHDEKPTNEILKSPHAVVADTHSPFGSTQCEACHGASREHIANSKNEASVVFSGKHVSPVAERNATCLTCHDAGLRTHWAGSQHESRNVACTDCHTMHAADQKVLSRVTQAEVCFSCHKTQRAETRRISTHPLALTSLATAPKMVCSDCHNPHGSAGPRLLKKNTVNEVCYSCHAEKRGPFLWEHAPVTEDCTNCHTPHGSANAPLLKTRVPWLCQECHSGDHGAQIDSGANLAGGNVTTVNGQQQPGAAAPRAQMAARACLNCHVLVHGSNHPAGAKFQR